MPFGKTLIRNMKLLLRIRLSAFPLVLKKRRLTVILLVMARLRSGRRVPFIRKRLTIGRLRVVLGLFLLRVVLLPSGMVRMRFRRFGRLPLWHRWLVRVMVLRLTRHRRRFSILLVRLLFGVSRIAPRVWCLVIIWKIIPFRRNIMFLRSMARSFPFESDLSPPIPYSKLSYWRNVRDLPKLCPSHAISDPTNRKRGKKYGNLI